MSAPTRTAGPPISRSGSGLPSRIILHGVEGIGKSSFAAFAPKPLFLMTRGETGLLSLIDNGQVGPTDHYPEFKDWLSFTSCLNAVVLDATDNRTLAIDTLNGAERLCWEHVCQTKYSGNWDSFLNYGRGPEVAQEEWLKMLTLLDRVRESRRLMVICLAHTKVKTFKNPEGDDYDRFAPDMHEKSWGNAHKWADVILFANYETFAKKDKGAMKAKGVSSGNRLFYTQRQAAYDAKNRLGLPPEIPMGDKPSDSWANFSAEAKKAREANRQANTSSTTETKGNE